MSDYERERRETYDMDWRNDSYEGEPEPKILGCEDCCRDLHRGETYFDKCDLIVCAECYEGRIEDGESTRNWKRMVNE